MRLLFTRSLSQRLVLLLAVLHDQGLLRADAKLARLMILGAINFSVTWYRAKPRSAKHVGLDALAAQTVALVLQPA